MDLREGSGASLLPAHHSSLATHRWKGMDVRVAWTVPEQCKYCQKNEDEKGDTRSHVVRKRLSEAKRHQHWQLCQSKYAKKHCASLEFGFTGSKCIFIRFRISGRIFHQSMHKNAVINVVKVVTHFILSIKLYNIK